MNAQVRRQSRRSLVVRASLTGKGQQFSADLINVKKIMGEGAYGQVFEVFYVIVCILCPHLTSSEQGNARRVHFPVAVAQKRSYSRESRSECRSVRHISFGTKTPVHIDLAV